MSGFIDNDFVKLRDSPKSNAKATRTLAFGDEVEILGTSGDFTQLRAMDYPAFDPVGFAPTKQLRIREKGILKFSMVDVQQGDGLIVETPTGKIVLIDGGDNKLFARHLAQRFRHRGGTKEKPLSVDAIIVTHGDADHFDGLNEIRRTETQRDISDFKRLFIHPKRVFHNGLVKAPGKNAAGKDRAETEMFGDTVVVDGVPFATNLYDDPRQSPEDMRNKPFSDWADSLQHWASRGDIDVSRVAFGPKAKALVDYFKQEGLEVEVQGPFSQLVKDPKTGKSVEGLVYFRAPEKGAEMHLANDAGTGSFSASHTINGHSIALRIGFGNVRISLTGDLNRPSMQLLFSKLKSDELEAEIVKAPHHGSHDFDFSALAAMKPVVAIISSGDENEQKEYIHPRATLLAALGKVMRQATGLIFNTELAAFFSTRDYSHTREELQKYFKKRLNDKFTGADLAKMFAGRNKEPELKDFFAFERTNFGIFHVRTDGERVLAFSHSGKKGVNEAYVFDVSKTATGRKVKFRKEAVSV